MLSTQAPKSYKTQQSQSQHQSGLSNISKDIQKKEETKVSKEKTENKDKPIQNQTINVVNITKNDSNSLVVEHDKDLHKFILRDNSNVLGHFTVGQIFKYINSDIEGYLINVDLGISVDLINNYLFKLENDTINFISHLSSPITGNIELLVKLYKDIQSFEPELQVEYEHLNEITKNIVRLRNKNFIYNVLTHIIKLFATYTSTNKKLSDDTRNMIMSYSIGAVYRLNTMVKEDLDYNLQKIQTLHDDLKNLKLVRGNMTQQLTKLENNVNMQNNKIDSLIENIQNTQNTHNGGGRTETTVTNSNITTSNITSSNLTSSNVKTNDKTNTETNSDSESETGSETESGSESDSDVNTLTITGDTISKTATNYTPSTNKNSVSSKISSFLSS
jgi:hypothetical protein